MAHSGRAGRHAVIYFGSMGDARKAMDESRMMANGNGGNNGAAASASSSSASSSPLLEGTEAYVFLADDEVVEDK